MAQTIRRGTPKRASQRSRKAAPRPSRIDRVIAALPIETAKVHRAMAWSASAIVGVAALAVAQLLGLPAMAGTAVGEMIGRAGFEVKRVDIRGIDRMERLTVYAVALQGSMAMPLVDLDGIRDELKRYGWVADARVSRRLPDTLVIDVVERKPAAIWQNEGRLALIDREGVVLEPVAVDAMPDLPLVIGPGANLQTADLETLVAAAPSLAPMMAGATWIGGRRWDIRFQSGEVLALPEGEAAARRALERFARMDGTERLLGRGFERFDMRDPKRLVVRLGDKQQAIDAVGRDAGSVAPPPAVAPAAPGAPLGQPLQRASQTT